VTGKPARTGWWGVGSAVVAPVALIGGWTVAAALQRGGFDQVTETISALAARDADHREVMTAALATVGVAHLTTAVALRSAGRPARVLHGVGGAATVLVAAFPLPAGDGHSAAHTAAAALAFGTLAAWPALVPRPVDRVAAGVLLGLVGWFAVELIGDGARVGLSERVAAGAQAIWPLLAVLRSRAGHHRNGCPEPGPGC
jgi:uncharacterized protein DUF998